MALREGAKVQAIDISLRTVKGPATRRRQDVAAATEQMERAVRTDSWL
jgi:hypothetical protein